MAGSIEYRGGNSWRLIVSCGLDSKKKQIKKTKTVRAKDEAAARELLAQFALDVERGLVPDGKKHTFKSFCEEVWLPKYAQTKLAPKTRYRYVEMLDPRIYDGIGHIKLEKLKPTQLMDFYDNLREEGIRMDKKNGRTTLSEQTVLHHHRLISSILGKAVKWKFLIENPASRAEAPKVEADEKDIQNKIYDEKELEAMLAVLENEPLKHRMFIHLALATGLREGELYGLEWPDFDMTDPDNATLSVNRSSQYLPDVGIFEKNPKSKNSKRDIDVPRYVVDMLLEHKDAQEKKAARLKDKWIESGRVFTAWNGREMFPAYMSSWFPKFLKRNKLPHLPFHGLRHTSATLSLADGINLASVSQKLGHADITTTQIYLHALKRVNREMAEKMQQRFGPQKEEDQEK